MSRTVIIPLVALLSLVLKLAFGVDISEDVQQQIIDVSTSVIAVVLVVIGIFKNPKKKVDKPSNK